MELLVQGTRMSTAVGSDRGQWQGQGWCWSRGRWSRGGVGEAVSDVVGGGGGGEQVRGGDDEETRTRTRRTLGEGLRTAEGLRKERERAPGKLGKLDRYIPRRPNQSCCVVVECLLSILSVCPFCLLAVSGCQGLKRKEASFTCLLLIPLLIIANHRRRGAPEPAVPRWSNKII